MPRRATHNGNRFSNAGADLSLAPLASDHPTCRTSTFTRFNAKYLALLCARVKLLNTICLTVCSLIVCHLPFTHPNTMMLDHNLTRVIPCLHVASRLPSIEKEASLQAGIH